METIKFVLYPIVWLFGLVFDGLVGLTGSYGLSVMLLSCFSAIISYPLVVYGRNAEARHKAVLDRMAPEIAVAKATLRGEERFHAIDKVYQSHGYHPIQGLAGVLGIAMQLPFLLASLVLLIDHPGLKGQSFLFINDLSAPDGLISLGGLTTNLLPFLMTGIALAEAAIKPELDRGSRIKFAIIAIALLALVFNLPSAVVLYWTTSNLISLVRTLLRLKSAPATA